MYNKKKRIFQKSLFKIILGYRDYYVLVNEFLYWNVNEKDKILMLEKLKYRINGKCCKCCKLKNK